MKFKYRARKGPSELIEGEIESENKDAALDKIVKDGLVPVSIVGAAPCGRPNGLNGLNRVGDRRSPTRGRIKPSDVNVFWRQLASLLKAKMTLLSSLDVCYHQTEKWKFKQIILDLYNEAKNGRQFSESMKKYPWIFPALYASVIKAGEVSGALDKAVDRIAQFGEREEEIRSRVQSALAYPIFMFCVGILTVIIILTFVIPKLSPMFMDMGGSLPLSTKILISSSGFLNKFWMILLPGFGLFFVIMWKGGVEPFKRFNRFKHKIPFIRQLVKKNCIGRFSRTFSLVLGSNLPIFQALNISIPTLGDAGAEKDLEQVCERIKSGSSLAGSLRDTKFFPVFVTNMIAVGEESGDLVMILDEIARIYEREVDKLIRIVSSLLEPALILSVGLVIGAIVMAIILPILEMNVLVK